MSKCLLVGLGNKSETEKIVVVAPLDATDGIIIILRKHGLLDAPPSTERKRQEESTYRSDP